VEVCGTYNNNKKNMNVDIEIYLSGMVKFFKDNPKDLLSLVPKDKENEFYSMLRKYSCDNFDKGDDYVLTRSQILEICVQLNDSKNILIFPKLIEENELEQLKSRLDKALEDEEYEEAVKLRDKIKEIS
jgi:hypothetical protein